MHAWQALTSRICTRGTNCECDATRTRTCTSPMHAGVGVKERALLTRSAYVACHAAAARRKSNVHTRMTSLAVY